MKKHLFIDLVAAGAMASLVFFGCAKADNKYCTAGMEKIADADYEGAIECFNGDISKNVNERDAYRGLGIAYYKLNNIPLAMQEFKVVIDKSGSKYDDICLDAMKYYAECLTLNGDYEGAIKYYTTIIDADKSKDKSVLYYLRGSAYIHLRDENNATLDFEKSLELKGDDYSMYCNMYNDFYEAGYVDRAQSYLKRLIANDDVSDFLVGKTHYIFGEYETAEKYLEKAVDDKDKDALYYLALTYEAEEKYVEAEKIYKDCIGKDKADPVIYNQYAVYLMNRDDYQAALTYIDKGLEKAEGRTRKTLEYNRIVCYEYYGKFDKAYEYAKQFIADYPDDEKGMREYRFLATRIG